RADRTAAEGGAIRPLEDAGRRRSVSAVRSPRRSRRTTRPRGAAHRHHPEAEGAARGLGEGRRSEDADPMTDPMMRKWFATVVWIGILLNWAFATWAFIKPVQLLAKFELGEV